MIRKILVFLIALSVHPFCRGQVITQQPVNDSICLGQQSAIFILACNTPDVTFTWEYRISPADAWAPINPGMQDFSGIMNDTLLVINAGYYSDFEFRCSLNSRFTDIFLEYSDIVQIIIIQPPVIDFGINQLSVSTDCYTFCPDTFINCFDLSQDTYLISGWFWDFGDGSTSVFQNPNHQYQGPGTYTISLTAWNEFGCNETTRKTVTILPVTNLLVNGPEIICSNQSSDEKDLYYSVTPYCDTCLYDWILPQEYILEKEDIDGATIRIHWKSVEEAVQLELSVIEHNNSCNRDCITGKAFKEVILKAHQSPDTAYKVMRKADDKAILIYLGEDMAMYRWGFTNKSTLDEAVDDEWNFNFCDYYQKFEINLDTNNYEFWVETSESECGECWTRSYYR